MEEASETPSEHQFWLKLSASGRVNIFSLIPDLLKRMFVQLDLPEDPDSPEDDFAYKLNSDYEWRIAIYYKLLRKLKREIERAQSGMTIPWREEEQPPQLHHWNIITKGPAKGEPCCPDAQRLSQQEPSVMGPGPVTWTVSDIAKAARLLTAPPMATGFDDEQEMRRVYTLIYDTFRYKGILNQALTDVAFFAMYPNLEPLITQVWLLFFDLYHRGFKKRDPAVIDNAIKLFEDCDVVVAEEALWHQRVKLAAAVSRLRIKNSALSLNKLLPKHLRDEKVNCSASCCPVTCWVNCNKLKSQEELLAALHQTLQLKLIGRSENLAEDTFRWDPLCPNFISFHHTKRGQLAKSSLVQRHKLVVQDRSFCLGPATFGKIITDLELAGTVVQSHVNSPRSTAYLATLLAQNSKIKSLLVFGAGKRKGQYETYFRDLGMKNIVLYGERLIDVPPESPCLEQVIAVFATPPNSYSAVADPIDLVCSRGGDLSMLEVLTETEITEEGKARVATILEEQKKTLKYAMSRPQIQLVLYETHSELDMENDQMVQRAMREINKLAKLKHATLQGKVRIPSGDISVSQDREINNNDDLDSLESSISKQQSILSKMSAETLDIFDKIYRDIEVPDCDIFDKLALPKLCPNDECKLKLENEGCYLALIQRKEVNKLDNKYMIHMAETRGLFGTNSTTSARMKSRAKAKKAEKRTITPPPSKMKKKNQHIEIDRIAAPTVSSLQHSTLADQVALQTCPRSSQDASFSKVPQMRQWWSETARHITSLRQSLVNKKILPPVPKRAQPTPRAIVSHLVHASCKLDEIVANSADGGIPVFPRLRLTRRAPKLEKVPLPVTVTLVQFRATSGSAPSNVKPPSNRRTSYSSSSSRKKA